MALFKSGSETQISLNQMLDTIHLTLMTGLYPVEALEPESNAT